MHTGVGYRLLSQPPGLTQTQVYKALGPRQGAGRVAARGNLQLCDALRGGGEMPPGGQGTCPEGPRVGRARMAPCTGWPDPLSRDLPLSGVPALGPPRALDSAHVSPDKHLLDISCPAPVLSACLHRQRGGRGRG